MALQFDELRVWREHNQRYEIESSGESFIAHTAKGATIENWFRKTFGTLAEAKEACEQHCTKFNSEADEPSSARLGT